jgi:hypothetical protein
MKAFKHFIKYSLKAGHTVSVYDGEEWQVKRSTGYKAIVEAVESVDEAQLRVRDIEGRVVAWALVSAYGLEDDETMMDWSDNVFTEAWSDTYDLTLV